MVRRLVHLGTALACAIAITVASETAVAGTDIATSDSPTVHTRKLHTELMVAALYCGQHSRYNAFVRRFQTELAANGKRLRAMFVNVHGNEHAVPHLDRFLTKMANDESRRRLALGGNYCREAQALFTQVLDLRETRQLVAFASSRAQSPAPDGRLTLLRPNSL